MNYLESAIEAQYIKIIPYEWLSKISLRLELYECPQGEKSLTGPIVFHMCIIRHAGVCSVKVDRTGINKNHNIFSSSRPDCFSLCSAGELSRFIVAQVVSDSCGRPERLAS